MKEADRKLVMLLGSIGIRMSDIITGLSEDSLSGDEQLAFANQLAELAEGFRRRVLKTPLVIDGEHVNRGGATGRIGGNI